MTVSVEAAVSSLPTFLEGIQYFGEPLPHFESLGQSPAIAAGSRAIADPTDPAAVYQTLLAADALRYLTLQVTASKASGHPGGFASSVEAYASLVMLGHKNIPTEVGHHAPGFYSAMFLDRSLEAMGILTVEQLRERFREQHGLLGHLSGFIPGILAPAGPLGQGQHFAMAAALLHPGTLFPVTIGDGGLGEPYVLSSIGHFHTAFPAVTNFLPVLVWNGFSQEHHSMVSTFTNEQMIRYWQANGFDQVILIDAKDFDAAGQSGAYADSTRFRFDQRLAFTAAVLAAADRAAKAALGGELTVLILKQLKGAGVHARGAKSHNLYAQHTLENPEIVSALQERALPVAAWQTVRTNFERAGGGPAARVAVTESVLPLANLGTLPVEDHALGSKVVATTAIGALVAHAGAADRRYLVSNADGNEASGIANINSALKIIHPTPDPLYNQAPDGQVYEPLSEDACAGLAAALALMGSRSLWCSYESFAINGLPIWQTVTQAMAELRRPTPSTLALFTAGALEQGRNGWTHQRPEIENYYAALMRNGNVFVLFPTDANVAQAAYEWALTTRNKGIAIIASKSPLPVRTTLAQARQALADGAIALAGDENPTVVFAVAGDMALVPVFEAAQQLAELDIRSRIVSVVNPRRLYRPTDVAWESCSEPDGEFLDDANFERLFGGEVLIAVTGGASGVLEPVLLRTRAPRREVFAWKRGETTASPAQLFAFNGLSAAALVERARTLIEES
ncbi:phosphoketolase [Gloeobacter kilaueensis]|uniref:Phosphoketolase n=1 Tax=Gloeobacter kilaueensis (strain ATCC BAA-2537 / CCAP 1431/1 / ULC 316 / JS1) TaxID=1183438 RepID=U5QC11_GLOK1|nr:phosphoketolase [Gloeobacter kilaueensis]AGY56381.1 phosphoketolase [Gloeobacter kilaueensis JS1]